MGLCKCPHKKVTTLFCFEHRVNVCEHCLEDSHPHCVVQSYLQWLTDSDYDTNCTLCSHPFTEGETVRLQCLHLFHWTCLDSWASQFPATTAPAGYRCPCCNDAIFPAPNQTSPTIEKLRIHLQKANWARAGLGLPILPELNKVPIPVAPLITNPIKQEVSNQAAAKVGGQEGFPVYQATPTHKNSNYRASTPATTLDVEDVSYSGSNEQVTFTARKKQYGGDDTRPLLHNDLGDTDSASNKYRRRPASEWLSGLWRAKYGSVPNQRSMKKKFFLAGFIMVIVVIVIFMGRSGNSESDPLFDPLANPNIRVAADDPSANHV